MPSPFELATAVEAIAPNVYRADVPPGWEQGRGAFGGLVLGLIARALVASEPDPSRTLRFLSGEIAGPVQPGETRVEVTVLRRGRNLTNLDARLLQGGEVVARASAGLSTTRKTAGESVQPVPPTPPPLASTVIRGVDDAFVPPFARHLEFRSTGPLPFGGGRDPIVEGYVREKVAPTRVDAPMIIALLDSYWPAIFSTSTTPRMAATASYTAQILSDPSGLDPAVPLFFRSSMVALRDGFFVEMRELWNEGTLVAMNQQTFALLG